MIPNEQGVELQNVSGYDTAQPYSNEQFYADQGGNHYASSGWDSNYSYDAGYGTRGEGSWAEPAGSFPASYGQPEKPAQTGKQMKPNLYNRGLAKHTWWYCLVYTVIPVSEKCIPPERRPHKASFLFSRAHAPKATFQGVRDTTPLLLTKRNS
jgi:hypothetical protein